MSKLNLAVISLVLSTALFPFKAVAQSKSSTLDILVEAYEGDKKVKDVEYSLSKDGTNIIQLTSKRGEFGFVIKPSDGELTLAISKEGYITKKIHFDSQSYPFNTEYESQEIIIECIPVSENMDEMVYAGTLKFDPLSNSYSVNKTDTMNARIVASLDQQTAKLDKVYDKAVHNGDGLMQIEEYEYAQGYYEIALVTRPEDTYATDQLEKAKEMAEEEKNKPVLIASTNPNPLTETEKEEKAAGNPESNNADVATEIAPKPKAENKAPSGDYYSVQLGAFVDWYDESVFANVSDLIVVQGSDYKRCIAGKFDSREDAISRMNELKGTGFNDAFIITMKGNERIGF